MTYRPRDIYPEHSKASAVRYLKEIGHRPIAFRLPLVGELFLAGRQDGRNDKISHGSLTLYSCYTPAWIPPTPRLIITSKEIQ